MPGKPRIAIIGAGPIGLEAALYARLKGYEVTVYERGRIAENVHHWGHVRMFSPFGMNTSEWGRAALLEAGCVLPDDDALLTGIEYVSQYLKPLSRHPAIAACLRERAHVASVTRSHFIKTDLVGDPRRADDPFRLLYSTGGPRASEETSTAEIVLDCTGSSERNPVCAGGFERHDEFLMWSHTLVYHIPDILGQYRATYSGRRVLVVGAGHSAATSIVLLQQLAYEDRDTSVIWVTRQPSDVPIRRLEDDRLPERDRLVEQANRIALDDTSAVEWLPHHLVYDLEGGRRKRLREMTQSVDDAPTPVTVTLESLSDGKRRKIVVDQIIANTGLRPDRSLYAELHVHECYATQGPMKLAAKLLGETSADCLDQASHGADVLRNPEPNFYILGMKSYGRNSNFLIRVGLQQIVDVFTLIEHDWRVSPHIPGV